MHATIGLTCQETQETTDLPPVPLAAHKGQSLLAHIGIPIAGASLGQAAGTWQLGVSVCGRPLGELRFAVVSPRAAHDAITLQDLALVAENDAGRRVEAKSMLYRSQFRSVTPLLTLSTEFPSTAPYTVSVAVLVDQEPVGEMEEQVVLDGQHTQLIPGQFDLPPLAAGQTAYRCCLVVSVAGRCLGVRELEVHATPPPGTDAQGRISAADKCGWVDYEAEADKLVNEAQVSKPRSVRA